MHRAIEDKNTLAALYLLNRAQVSVEPVVFPTALSELRLFGSSPLMLVTHLYTSTDVTFIFTPFESFRQLIPTPIPVNSNAVSRFLEFASAIMHLRVLPQDLGLSVDERDMDGISVLDTAASMGDTTLTRVLCQRGLAYAAESAPDGWSPLMKVCCGFICSFATAS